jgi:hypothetical protein
MSQNELLTMSLYQLNKLCQIGEANALREWKRRWETDYPNIAEINTSQGKRAIPYFKNKMPGATTPGKKTIISTPSL